jgi:protein SCO1
MFKYLFIFSLFLTVLISCKETPKLPTYGKEAIKTDIGYDTIIKPVAPFEFIDQKGEVVTNGTLKGKIFVTDFFFTSCPSICPVMAKQMLRIHDAYIDNDQILFLSHSIDPTRDSIQTLNNYADKIGILTNAKWHFVRGEKEAIAAMAEDYMIVAYEDDEVPGGFEHSGYFILVDGAQHVRGYYDGTSQHDVTKLIADIEVLLNER